MKVAIVCDNWKLSIFEKALKQGLFLYAKSDFSPTVTTIVVTIGTARLAELENIVYDCERKCQERADQYVAKEKKGDKS